MRIETLKQTNRAGVFFAIASFAFTNIYANKKVSAIAHCCFYGVSVSQKLATGAKVIYYKSLPSIINIIVGINMRLTHDLQLVNSRAF